MAAQNEYTRSLLDPLPDRGTIRAGLDQLLMTGSVDVPTVRGARHFYTRRGGQQDQPVLLLREGADGTERTLLDPNAMSATGLVALVLLIVGLVRGLDVAIPGDVWIVYVILGAVCLLAGLFLWSKRSGTTA